MYKYGYKAIMLTLVTRLVSRKYEYRYDSRKKKTHSTKRTTCSLNKHKIIQSLTINLCICVIM